MEGGKVDGRFWKAKSGWKNVLEGEKRVKEDFERAYES